MKKVSIITINWNSLDETLELLNSLSKIDYNNYEVIVIDNASKNKEADIIKKKFRNVKLLKNKENEGYCKANNKGIKYALKNGSDYILLLNNDTLVKKNFLSILVNYYESKKDVGGLSPQILLHNTHKIWSLGGTHLDIFGISIMEGKGQNMIRGEKILNPDFLTGCCLLLSRQLINKVGYLDENFFAYYEDVDYSKRIRDNGLVLSVLTKSIIWHKKSASSGIKGSNKLSKNQVYLHMRNSLLLIKKRYNFPLSLLYILSTILVKGMYLFLHQDKYSYTKQIYGGLKDGIKQKI